MKLKPVGKHLLVKLHKLEDTDPVYARAHRAGIAMPEIKEKILAQRAVERATVVAISPKAWKDWFDGQPWCEVGDDVIFAKYGGHVIKDGEEEFVLLNDEDLLCIICKEGIDENVS